MNDYTKLGRILPISKWWEFHHDSVIKALASSDVLPEALLRDMTGCQDRTTWTRVAHVLKERAHATASGLSKSRKWRISTKGREYVRQQRIAKVEQELREARED